MTGGEVRKRRRMWRLSRGSEISGRAVAWIGRDGVGYCEYGSGCRWGGVLGSWGLGPWALWKVSLARGRSVGGLSYEVGKVR